MKPVFHLPLAVALALGFTFFPTRTEGLPRSASNVWRLATKAGGSSSACPVRTLTDGRMLFLTARHAVARFGVKKTVGAIVENADKTRKLVIDDYIKHPTLDIAVLVVKGDGKPVKVLKIDLLGVSQGDKVYSVGYPGPFLSWFAYEGFVGARVGSSSSYVERGMSGGALLDEHGSLSGILVAHAAELENVYVKNAKGVRSHGFYRKHYPHQSLFVPLKGLQVWLRQVKIL